MSAIQISKIPSRTNTCSFPKSGLQCHVTGKGFQCHILPRVYLEDTCLAGLTTKPANSPRFWRSPPWVLELAFTGRQLRSPRWQGPRLKSPTELILSSWRRCQRKQRTTTPPPTPLQRLTTLRQTTSSTTLTPQTWHPCHSSSTPMHSHILVIIHLKQDSVRNCRVPKQWAISIMLFMPEGCWSKPTNRELWEVARHQTSPKFPMRYLPPALWHK